MTHRTSEALAIDTDSDHRAKEDMPKEKPILFSAPMVRAILADRKTVTRRIVHPRMYIEVDPDEGPIVEQWDPQFGKIATEYARSPYGDEGDRLWVRETFAPDVPGCESQGGVSYRADHQDPRGDGPANPMKWKPSIFMRRRESRITLEVVSVRIERLHEITEQDAIAEGVSELGFPRDTFAELWDVINGKRAAWASNPWVWRVEFRRLTQAEARHVA